jgi:putative N6-adenine-specific DNA methylase
MRIGLFKASNFSQLQRKLGVIPWELYLDPGHMLDFRVSTSHSRLYHKDAIAQRIEKSISERFLKIKINEDLYPQKYL